MNTIDPKEAREEAIREAKRNLILDAARNVFAQKGYWETRLEDIGAAAGFSKASLYNYYSDKEAIFLSLAIREYGKIVQRLETAVDMGATFVSNLETVLKSLFYSFEEYFPFVLATANFQTMIHLQIEMCKHEDLVNQLHEAIDRAQLSVMRIIAAARARGEIRSPLDDAALSRNIGALIRGTFFEWKSSGKIGDIDGSIRNLVRFAARGVDCGDGAAVTAGAGSAVA
jgi:AcrR family transcriptional regulator